MRNVELFINSVDACPCRHADGSLKFWDASAGNFQLLYKIRTSRVFERARRNKHHPTISGADAEHELSSISNAGAGAGANCEERERNGAAARAQADSGIESCTSTATPSVSSPSSFATSPPAASASGSSVVARSSPHNSSSVVEPTTSSPAPASGRTCSDSAVTPASAPTQSLLDEDIYAVNQLSFCPDSRRLLVAASFHALLFNFSRKEIVSEVTVSPPAF